MFTFSMKGGHPHTALYTYRCHFLSLAEGGGCGGFPFLPDWKAWAWHLVEWSALPGKGFMQSCSAVVHEGKLAKELSSSKFI